MTVAIRGTCIELARRDAAAANLLTFAASSADEVAYGALTKEILGSWKQGRVFEPKDEKILIELIEIYDPWVEAGNSACSLIDGLWQINSIQNAERKVGERHKLSPYMRWGAPLYHLFFPKSQICEP